MIVNPYSEVISLHDMNIIKFEIKNNNAYVYFQNAYLFTADQDYMLNNPVIIAHDIIDLDTNDDYPVRLKFFDNYEVCTVSLDDFNEFSFNIVEEAYGFGLVHFYGIATKYDGKKVYSYDAIIDIHYRGDLEIKWDEKVTIEA